MDAFDLWTDGACSAVVSKGQRAIGVGGWAAILISPGAKLSVWGWDAETTNNRMELTAVVEGLRTIGEQRSIVVVHTDSAYVKNAYTQGWLKGWQKNGWTSHRGDQVANQDLWKALLLLTDKHAVSWKKVKGHGTTVLNNEVDALAVRAKRARESGVVLT